MNLKTLTLTSAIALCLSMSIALGAWSSPAHAGSDEKDIIITTPAVNDAPPAASQRPKIVWPTNMNPAVVVKKADFKKEIFGSDRPVITLVIGNDCTSCAATEKIFRDLSDVFWGVKFVIVDVADTKTRPDQLPAITTTQPQFFTTLVAKTHNVNWAGNVCSAGVADKASVRNFIHKRLAALLVLSVLADNMRQISAEQKAKRELLITTVESNQPGPARDNQVGVLFFELDVLMLQHEEIVKDSLFLIKTEAAVR